METEFGSSCPIRFANATMYDSEGKESLCKCGKPVARAIIGKETYVVRCEECHPYNGAFSTEFVYRPPTV